MPPRSGERFGRYELGDLLGRGGMGEVYSAHDVILQRRVALKVVIRASEKEAGASEGAARLLREARAAARISHPNAVSIFDVGEVGEIPFIAMEYVSGRTLRAYVGDEAIPLARRLRWLIGVARGLGAAHQLGLVHRDVKPDNVIVGDDDEVKVLDFGIARRAVTKGDASPEEYAPALGTLTAEGVVVGTPLYMAPEQMRGDALEGRADQFSWGVLAYELLTGKPPWEGTGLALVSQILSREIESLQGTVPELPARVDAVVRIALSKSPAGRFATMEELAEELEPYAAPAGAGDLLPVPASRAMEQAATELVASTPSGAQKHELTLRAQVATVPPSRLRGTAVAVVAAVVLVLAGGVGVVRLRASRRAASVALDASPAAEAPSEMSANTDATAAYVAGTRAMHDAAMGTAFKQLNRAVELDPLFAAAHLRRAIMMVVLGEGFTTAFKDDLEQARNARVTLGGHDRLVLESFEPWTRVPPDLAESQRRFESAMKSHPADADFPFELAMVLDAAVKPKEALAVLRSAVALDPTLASAWRFIAQECLVLDDVAGAGVAYDRCVEVAPGATSCLGDLSVLQANEGRCEELVRTGRRLIALAPESPPTYGALANGLLGSGQPLDEVRNALGKQWDRESSAERRVSQLEDEASLAILKGDFAGAERQYEERERLSASAPDAKAHFESSYGRMLVDLEIGRSAQAAKLAEMYLRRRSAWSAGPDQTIAVYVVQLLGGGINRRQFNALRDQWLEQDPDVPAAYRWIEAYALPVETREEALAALAVMPEVHPFIPALDTKPGYTEPLGRTYLLAGRLDEAIRYLSQASTSCPSLEISVETIPATEAAFELGRALEAKGDRPGACTAYQRVFRRWGSAIPASLTAVKALGRSRSLGCEL